jgi:hypothetical protein
MLKINYKGYEISQTSNKHVAIFKNNQMVFHAECQLELDELGLKRILDWYLILAKEVGDKENEN